MARATTTALDLAAFDAHRPALMRFAMLQVRDKAVAEDLVQETFLAALSGAGGFSGESSLRTWLTGILRHKILDHVRVSGRQVSMEDLAGDGSEDVVDAMFRATGAYVASPLDWGDPAELLSQRRFMEALERCVAGLPTITAQAFLMRDMMGCETADICKELAISSTNCFVLLHRARMRLRACLEASWVGTGGRK